NVAIRRILRLSRACSASSSSRHRATSRRYAGVPNDAISLGLAGAERAGGHGRELTAAIVLGPDRLSEPDAHNLTSCLANYVKLFRAIRSMCVYSLWGEAASTRRTQ